MKLTNKPQKRESNCFQVDLNNSGLILENNFRGQNIIKKKKTYIVWHQIKIYQNLGNQGNRTNNEDKNHSTKTDQKVTCDQMIRQEH